jgi:phage terminase small subunit
MTRKALSATKQREKKSKKRKGAKRVTGELIAKQEVSYDKLLKQLPKQRQRFVQEYLVDLNGKQAAIRAGYSEKTAKEQASQLLTYLNVSQAIEAGHQRLAELVKVRQYEIVREFKKIGFADMRDFSKWGPEGVELTDSEALTPEQTACVAEVSEQTTESSRHVKFKLHNKIDALNSLAKHLGMFPNKVEQPKEVQPVQFDIVINPTNKHEGESRRRVVKDVPARQIDHL